MKFLGLFLITLSLTGEVLGKECQTNKGLLSNPFDFGSPEQIKHIKNELLRGCDLIGVGYQPTPTMVKVLVLDTNAGKMFRYTMVNGDPGGPGWEGWFGFSKKQLLDDDPTDGFDLPNYINGRGVKVPGSIFSDNIQRLILELLP